MAIADTDGTRYPIVRGEDDCVDHLHLRNDGNQQGRDAEPLQHLGDGDGLLAAWRWERDDRLLLCLPLYHVHGLFVGLITGLAAGATILLRSGYQGDGTVREFLGGEPTLFFAVPTIYVRLVAALRELESDGAVPHAPLLFRQRARYRQRYLRNSTALTGHTILERYGMTETGMNLSNPYAGVRRAGTVGTPLPGVEMRIVNHAGEAVEDGDEGEVLIHGSNVFAGYWNAPEKTTESFLHDEVGRRWFRTGDLARQDPETGYISLLGRRHELIISGGLNIYPREIEELLETFPGIEEAAVVGRPHPEWGEVPVAHVVCSAEFDDASVEVFCRQHLASYKLPAEIFRVPALPRNAMGKLQKHLL